jgi:hypothetical protein
MEEAFFLKRIYCNIII